MLFVQPASGNLASIVVRLFNFLLLAPGFELLPTQLLPNMGKPMLRNHVRSFLLLSFLLFGFEVRAQQPFVVAIVSDAAEEGIHPFEGAIKAEITALLASRYELSFTEIYTNGDINNINNAIATTYSANQADVVIGSGVISSKILANRGSYSIPTIASIQITADDHQQVTATEKTSGIPNFTYISSAFNIAAGIQVLHQICRCEKLAVLTNAGFSTIGLNKEDIYPDSEPELEWLPLTQELSNTVASIPDDVGGVYILSPLANYPPGEVSRFLTQLNERKLPSFTLFDSPMLELGAYAAFISKDNLQKITRRIALNVEKVAEGNDPRDFPVDVEAFTNQLVVNMETVNKIGKYPNWTLLDNALLVNINRPNATRMLSLKGAIAEGIENNLGYSIETKQTQISAQDLNLAKSNYLPQLTLESTAFFLDSNTVNSSFGTRGSFNWTAEASFSQLILSEPALANIAIQKLLFESQQQVQKQSELDVILEVAQRYFNYMQVLSVAELQNDNIRAINQNLTIASDKAQVGYSGTSDVYRWQTELYLAKADLYNTNAQLKAVSFQLNESLNRPIDEVFAIEGTEDINQFISQLDETFLAFIQDQQAFARLTDFMVTEARQNLPEAQQIQLAISAQERLLKSNKRSFYLPTLGFGAGYEYPLSIVNPGDPLPIPGVTITNNPTWNAAFQLSIPITAGGSRSFQLEKTRVGLYQLQDQQMDIYNLLELQVRANMELVNASFNNMRLTRQAASSAEKNIEIVRNLYQSGQVDVITLVDAQNALLGAQINATNAAYQFMIDYFSLQRSVGNYTFLATDLQKVELIQRFLNFKKD